MANLYRLVLGALLLAFTASAFAVPAVILRKTWGITQFNNPYSSIAEACNAGLIARGPPAVQFYMFAPTVCRFADANGNDTTGGNQLYSSSHYSCPLNSTKSPVKSQYFDGYDSPQPQSCACNAGFWDAANNGVCVPVGTPTGPVETPELSVCRLLNLTKAPLVHAGGLGLTACYLGTTVTGTGAVRSTTGSEVSLFGPFQCSKTCDGVPSGASAAPSPCAANEFTGTVNGVEVCIPASQAPEVVVQGEKEVIAPPAGAASGTAPTGSISGAPAGTVTSSSTFQCLGASCTRTTTFSDLNGAGLGTRTETVPKAKFCEENKGISICAERSFKGKACPATSIECDGDAIACGIAYRQQLSACQLEVKDAEEVTFYNTDKNKPGNTTAELAGNSTVNISGASFSTAELLGGSCIADRSVTVVGQVVSIPFSSLCQYFALLGNALLAVALLVGARIISRGQ